jgi:hypothetical protein
MEAVRFLKMSVVSTVLHGVLSEKTFPVAVAVVRATYYTHRLTSVSSVIWPSAPMRTADCAVMQVTGHQNAMYNHLLIRRQEAIVDGAALGNSVSQIFWSKPPANLYEIMNKRRYRRRTDCCSWDWEGFRTPSDTVLTFKIRIIGRRVRGFAQCRKIGNFNLHPDDVTDFFILPNPSSCNGPWGLLSL